MMLQSFPNHFCLFYSHHDSAPPRRKVRGGAAGLSGASYNLSSRVDADHIVVILPQGSPPQQGSLSLCQAGAC